MWAVNEQGEVLVQRGCPTVSATLVTVVAYGLQKVPFPAMEITTAFSLNRWLQFLSMYCFSRSSLILNLILGSHWFVRNWKQMQVGLPPVMQGVWIPGLYTGISCCFSELWTVVLIQLSTSTVHELTMLIFRGAILLINIFFLSQWTSERPWVCGTIHYC